MAERDSDPAIPALAPAPPRAVAGYQLLRKIGAGGMSAVYQSYDVTAARPVAVKLLSDVLAGQTEFVNRFYREARLSSTLEHPNLVHGFTSGFDRATGKHYLVMELVDGPNAHAALARLGRFPVGVAARVGLDIARALEFLHERRYVHRDVKPDNILLHPGGAKLADLGLAKHLSDESHLTALNQGIGTPYYMPYEQAVNANLVDGRSDIFALGATLYHLLTGTVPFPGTTPDDVQREKWTGAFRPIRELNPGVPPELAALVEGALALDPRARLQKVGQFARALDALNLATAIPALAFGDATGTDDAPDCPTRPDVRTAAAARAIPVAPPGAEPFVARFAVPPVLPSARRARGARLWAWIGAGALLGALAAHALTRPAAQREDAAPAQACEVPPEPRSPLPSVPQ
jgi:eukaryotic-like serine/threonine-protein kinase